jgi:hypothetical protein
MTLAEIRREDAGKTKLTAVSVTSLDRNKHVTIFVMATHDLDGKIRIGQGLLARAMDKAGFYPGERCNFA